MSWDIFDRDRVHIIPIASFEAREFDAEGNPVFRRVNVKFASEDAFLNAVVDVAKMAGWMIHHDRLRQNVLGHAGFPDLVLVRRGRVIFAELKRDDKEPTPEQQKWLDELLEPLSDNMYGSPVESVCWHPADWERIVEILTRR